MEQKTNLNFKYRLTDSLRTDSEKKRSWGYSRQLNERFSAIAAVGIKANFILGIIRKRKQDNIIMILYDFIVRPYLEYCV